CGVWGWLGTLALPFDDSERAIAPTLAPLAPASVDDSALHATILSFPGGLGEPGDEARARPRRGGYRFVKEAIDVVAACILFVLALPVIGIIAVLIATTSPGGVFFRQTRVGQGMQPFQCLKFRTMVPDAESILAKDPELARIHALNWKLDNDPRVTRVGRFLRKTSLDELPQLVNVINGEMSLIGPRPVQFAEVREHYGEAAHTVFSVRPGVTGLWQVSGRSTTSYSARIALDSAYVQEQSLVIDLKILVKTVIVVVRGTGAH
ncbi:MAG: sugar transferase, partial [Thermomicrobiales bacterium]